MRQLFLFLLSTIIQQSIFSQTVMYVPKAVHVKKESVKVNGTLNSTFGGNSKVLVEVSLPPGTAEWYFSFKTSRDKQSEQAIGTAINLTTKIAGLLASSSTGGASVKFAGLAESSIKSLAITKGEVPVNVYAFDLYNSQIFLKGDGSHILNGSYNVSQSEGNSLVRSFKSGTAYIGIDNQNIRTGCWVDVEVTATVLERKIVNNTQIEQPSSTIYNMNEFIGKWKDENSTFTMSEAGNFYIRWNAGQTASGRWALINNKLNFDFSGVASNSYKRNDYYKILFWDGRKLTYQQIINGEPSGTTYNAEKLSQ